MTVPMRRPATAPAISPLEDVLIRGNLADLSPEQRTEYYMKVCGSIGLNPLTRPFEYLTLNGKLVLYARRDCADQLRKINGISIEIVSQDRIGELLSIHVRAKDKTGRTDEDLGVVSLPQAMKGEAAANTILKAVTKAKRRVTLSISGLGFLDETEVEDIPRTNGAPKQAALPPSAKETITEQQVQDLNNLLTATRSGTDAFLRIAGVECIPDILANEFAPLKRMLEEKKALQTKNTETEQ